MRVVQGHPSIIGQQVTFTSSGIKVGPRTVTTSSITRAARVRTETCTGCKLIAALVWGLLTCGIGAIVALFVAGRKPVVKIQVNGKATFEVRCETAGHARRLESLAMASPF